MSSASTRARFSLCGGMAEEAQIPREQQTKSGDLLLCGEGGRGRGEGGEQTRRNFLDSSGSQHYCGKLNYLLTVCVCVCVCVLFGLNATTRIYNFAITVIYFCYNPTLSYPTSAAVYYLPNPSSAPLFGPVLLFLCAFLSVGAHIITSAGI